METAKTTTNDINPKKNILQDEQENKHLINHYRDVKTDVLR